MIAFVFFCLLALISVVALAGLVWLFHNAPSADAQIIYTILGIVCLIILAVGLGNAGAIAYKLTIP
jgi:hypothetical protein